MERHTGPCEWACPNICDYVTYFRRYRSTSTNSIVWKCCRRLKGWCNGHKKLFGERSSDERPQPPRRRTVRQAASAESCENMTRWRDPASLSRQGPSSPLWLQFDLNTVSSVTPAYQTDKGCNCTLQVYEILSICINVVFTHRIDCAIWKIRFPSWRFDCIVASPNTWESSAFYPGS